jgi:hypothetical protein
MVEDEDYTISQAAQLLNIKLSTAKLIVTRFRKTGTVFIRKREKRETPTPSPSPTHRRNGKPPQQLPASPQMQPQEEGGESCRAEEELPAAFCSPTWICYYNWPPFPFLYPSLAFPQ